MAEYEMSEKTKKYLAKNKPTKDAILKKSGIAWKSTYLMPLKSAINTSLKEI